MNVTDIQSHTILPIHITQMSDKTSTQRPDIVLILLTTTLFPTLSGILLFYCNVSSIQPLAAMPQLK